MSEITQLLERLIKFPNAQVCKHYAALLVVEHLMENPSPELVEAIVEADDEAVLNLLKTYE